MANQLYSLRLRSLGASYVSRNGRNDRILLPLLKSAAQISAERYYNRLFIDPFNIAQTTKRLDCLLHLLCICGSPLQETQNELPSGLRSPNRTSLVSTSLYSLVLVICSTVGELYSTDRSWWGLWISFQHHSILRGIHSTLFISNGRHFSLSALVQNNSGYCARWYVMVPPTGLEPVSTA